MQSPQISPDGAYWWDGQAWRPMSPPTPPLQAPAPAAQDARPSWLPAEVEVPVQAFAAQATPATQIATALERAGPPDPYVAPTGGMAPPPWMAPAPSPSSSRTLVMVAAVAAFALMAGGAGFWALHQSGGQNDAASTAGPAAPAAGAASPAASPNPTPQLPAAVLTAHLEGQYCPVAHPGDNACWKGTFINTGPPIGKLAMIFVSGAPYSNWFANHANEALSGFYTSAGCDVDSTNSRIVCGPVALNQEVDVYLAGDVTTRGTFDYAVKFADISSGSPVYVNQHPDGTHDVVSWRESIG